MIKHKKVETPVEQENVDYEMNKAGFEISNVIGWFDLPKASIQKPL